MTQQTVAMTFTKTSQTMNYQLVALHELGGNTEMFVDINDCLSDK